MRKTTVGKRMLAGMLSAVLAVTALPLASLTTPQKEVKAASVTLQNPRIVKDDSMQAGQKVTWDCIWFGSYPQREVVADAAGYDAIYEVYYNPQTDIIEDAALFQKLETASGWSGNELLLDGNKYRRMKQEDATYSRSNSAYYRWKDNTSWHYFRYEPIKWRVLSTAGDQAFLQADLALDDQRYNNNNTSVTWETCSMRSWLNGYGPETNEPQKDYRNDSFLQDAFTSAQQQAIRTTEVENADNLYYGTEGGNNTTDKIFLLSEQEVYGTKASSYGFAESYDTYDEARRRKSSTYAKAKGVRSDYGDGAGYDGKCCWWLRMLGHDAKYIMEVTPSGYVYRDGDIVIFIDKGVCPALNLNLSSSDLWSYAGTVCSDGTVKEEAASGSGGGSGETPGGGSDSETLPKMELDTSSLSEDTFQVGDEKQLPYSLYAESESKLKEMVDSLSWTDEGGKLVIADGMLVMPTAPEKLGDQMVWRMSSSIIIAAKQEGKTTLIGKISDGTTVKQEIEIVPEFDENDNGSVGGGGALELGGDASGNAGAKIAKFFPSNFSMKAMRFPIEVSREEEKNGTSKIKMSIGIGKKDLLDKESSWDQYKKCIENFDDAAEDFDKMMKKFKPWDLKSNSSFKPERYEKKPQVSVAGYLELTLDKNGKLIKKSGKIGGAAKWSGSATWKFLTSIGPVYLNLDQEGKMSGKLGLLYDVDENKLKPDGNFQFVPKMTLEGGYGFDKVLAVGAYGEISTPVTLLPTFKAEAEATAGVHLQAVMVIDYEQSLPKLQVTLWDFGKKEEEKEVKTLQLSQNSMKEIDTSFAKDTSAWNGGAERKTRNTGDSSGNIIRSLQQSVLPSALPMQAQIGEKKVMVFQAYDENRSTLNGTVLKYSVCENGIWSEPKAVYDDGCADSYADMKVVNGKLVLTWQKTKKQVTGSVELDSTGVLQQMAENAEIYYAEFDEATKTFQKVTQVTDNAVCDMLPQIAESNNEVVVAWIRNDAESLMQESGTNSICMEKRGASGFGQEETLTTASGTIDSYVVYQDEAGIQSAFIGETNHVKAVFDTNGNVFKEFAELMTKSDDGTITSLHYADGKLGCILNGKLYQYDLAEKKRTAYDAGEDAFGGQVRYCTNGEKEGYIWSLYDEDSGTGKLMASMKTEDGYSKPIILLEEKNKMWRYFSPLLDTDGNWTVAANALDMESDRNELMYLEKEQQKKLEVDEVTIDETDMVDGLTGVTYLVTNPEDTAVDQMEVEILLADGSKITKTIPVHLEPGESSAGTTYVDLSQVTDTQNVSLCIAAEGQKEKEENTKELPVGRADIAVEASAEENENQVHITVQLKNQSAQAAQTDVALYADADRSEELQRQKAVTVPENGQKTVTFTLNKKDIVYNENDAAYLTVYAEVKDGDSEENNNTAYAVLYKPKQNTPQESETSSQKPSESEPVTSTPAAPSNPPAQNDQNNQDNQTSAIKAGYTAKVGQAQYRVTAAGTSRTVEYQKPATKTQKNVKIPATVTINKEVYKVTSIAKNACKGNKKLKTVTVGKNIKTIGANAFAGCKNLKTIRIASTSLTKKSVGKNAFKGIHKKAVIKVPKKKLKAYQKFLKGKGQAKSVKIKK